MYDKSPLPPGVLLSEDLVLKKKFSCNILVNESQFSHASKIAGVN